MVIHLSNGEVLRYHRDFDLWMRELERVFPGYDHRKFWGLVRKIDGWGWLALENLFHVRNARLAPFMLVSTELMLKNYGLDFREYRELIDGILLISAQSTSDNIPFFVGCMALAYPSQSFAVEGGMKGLMTFFEDEMLKRGIELRKNEEVRELPKGFKQTILNIPLWNVARVLGDQEPKLKGGWGAFTVYLGVKGEFKELYQQIHLSDPDVPNYFVSFSSPGDLGRAPEGWQAVTMSTHVFASDWLGLDKATYTAKKKKFERVILQDFLKRFGISETKFITSGTPKTFQDYTGRESGFVGGLPFLYGKNPFRLPFGGTSQSSVWMVGDTVFPGQGIVGVVAGAFLLEKRMRWK
jgi:hypothetical protein